MPFLFVFPNQSPSRAPRATRGCCLEGQALSQSGCVCGGSGLHLPGTAQQSGGPQAQRPKKLYLFIGPFEVCVAISRTPSARLQQLSRAQLGRRTWGCATSRGLPAGAYSRPSGVPRQAGFCFLS